MATKWFYNANEALSFVLEARSDSELADLSDAMMITMIQRHLIFLKGLLKSMKRAMNEYAALEHAEEEKESNKNI